MSNPTRWVGIDLHRRRSQIAREGILPEHTDLFGKAGREFLADLQLPDGPSRRLRSMLSLLDDFDREITATTNEIDQRARTDERVKLLCQIHGIGRYTALLIIAEVGDVGRFPTASHLCSWAGLAPPSAAPTAKPDSDTSPAKAPPSCAEHSPKPHSTSRPLAARYASSSNGSRNAADGASPKSRSPAQGGRSGELAPVSDLLLTNEQDGRPFD